MSTSSDATQLLHSLPMPLAQVLVRALNARTAVEAHHRAYDLGEAALKLVACARLGLWLGFDEADNDADDDDADVGPGVRAVSLDRLRQPSVGHWVGLLREAGRALQLVAESSGHPLLRAVARKQVRPAVTRWAEAAERRELFSREQVRQARSGTLEAAFGLLASYRNQVLGHGAQRDAAFYREMGHLLLEAVVELLRDDRPLAGLELAVSRAGVDDGGAVSLDWIGLVGVVGLPLDASALPTGLPDKGAIEPMRLYLLGAELPVPLHPLALYQRLAEPERERVGFLSRTRGLGSGPSKPGGRRARVEYLDYTSGETFTDDEAAFEVQRLLAGGRDGSRRPWARVARPAVPSGAPLHNLPHDASAFVGRRVELQALDALFDAGARLVTIIGPAGTGKTRLALQHARGALDRDALRGGAWLCDLTEARSLAGVCDAVAQALDVPLTQRDPVEQLGNAILGRGAALLVLDNVEQVIDVATETLQRWLDRAPEAWFLATSRELLRMGAERVIELEPLPVPRADPPTLEALRDNDAARLFVERARATRPGFSLDAANAAAVGELLRLLDGLPLAIELAAARIRVLRPRQVVERLSRRFDLLRGTRRDVSGRQTTLRAAIDWSWELLEGWEQSALAQCSVFHGGFTLEAAEAVIDLDSWPEAPWAMDAVQALVDKSLLRRFLPGAESEADGPGSELLAPRFGMYVSIQEYAAEKLSEGDADPGGAGRESVQARHGNYYAAMGTDEALEQLRGEGAPGFSRLWVERDNLAAAVRRASASGRPEIAAPCCLALWQILQRRGPVAVGRERIEDVLALPGSSESWRLRLLHARAYAGIMTGQHEAARATLDEALELARALGDRRQEGRLLGTLGDLYQQRGGLEEARDFLTAALDIAREVGDRRREGIGLGYLGIACHDLGLHGQARAHYEQALHILRDVGDRKGEGYFLCTLGNLLAEEGAIDDARAQQTAALEAAREARDRRLEGYVLDNLGDVERRLGHLDEALARHEAALALARQVGDRRLEGYNLASLGQLGLDGARLDEAEARLEGARQRAEEVADRRLRVYVRGHVGRLALLRGDEERATTELDSALAEAEAIGDPHLIAEMKVRRDDLLPAHRDDAS